jgi:hypothetical protein
MTVSMKDAFIVFKATQEGPQPVIIEETEQKAILFIRESQRITKDFHGWTYAKCPQRVWQAHRVVAGQMPGYRIPPSRDPNQG